MFVFGTGPGIGPGMGPGIGPGIGPGMGPGKGPGIGPGGKGRVRLFPKGGIGPGNGPGGNGIVLLFPKGGSGNGFGPPIRGNGIIVLFFTDLSLRAYAVTDNTTIKRIPAFIFLGVINTRVSLTKTIKQQ